MDDNRLEKLDELKFLGDKDKAQNIGFLRKVLLDNSLFKKRIINGQEEWVLRFFNGESYQQTFIVKLAEQKDKYIYQADNILSTSGIVLPCGRSRLDIHSRYIRTLSKKTRNNHTLTKQDLTENNANHYCIRSKDMAFIAQYHSQEAQFNRYIILKALAFAYLHAFEKIGDELINKLKLEDNKNSAENLDELLSKASRFNAVFYFRHPVTVKNQELPMIWEALERVLYINDSQKELFEQMQMAHDIINERSKKEARNQERERQERQTQWQNQQTQWQTHLQNLFLIFTFFQIFLAIIQTYLEKDGDSLNYNQLICSIAGSFLLSVLLALLISKLLSIYARSKLSRWLATPISKIPATFNKPPKQ